MKKIKRCVAVLAGLACLLTGWGAVADQETETIPIYELMRFSKFEREYNADTNDLLYGDTLYANWTRADNLESEDGVDVETDYPGRENLRLKVTIDLSSTDASQTPDAAWDSLTVKLRSVNVKDKEGDPELKINGGNSETNDEHNYGWNIRPDQVSMQNGHLELSIPLNRPADNHRGLMDWTQVQRIILTMRLRDSVVADEMADTYTMRLSEVRVVNDVMEIARDRVRAAADDHFPEGIVYRQDSLELFAATRQQALALVADETALLSQLNAMAQQMQQVRDNMVEITYDAANFSRLCGSYPGESQQTLYADWAYADQGGDGVGVDLSHHDFSRTMLLLELDLQGPEGYDGVWNTDGWVLLRSVDEDGARCTYGWRLAAEDAAIGQLHTGINRLCIPLDAAAEDGYNVLQSDPTAPRQGAMNWRAVNRMQVYLAPENYQKGAFTMTVTTARVVDMTQPAEEIVKLRAAVEQPVKTERHYTPDSWQAYTDARAQAQAVDTAYPYMSPEAIRQATAALDQARLALAEVPVYAVGDVDGDGTVTIADALAALQAASGQVELDISAQRAADVDGAAGISAADAWLILQSVTGGAALAAD